MAKKLYGAALAAHERKRARSGGGAKRTVALARRGPQSITVNVKEPKAKRRKGSGRRRGSGGGKTTLGQRAWPAGMAGLWGWVKGNRADVVAELSKLPMTETLGLETVIALIEHGILEYTSWVPPGFFRKAIDADATAKLVLASYAFGHSGFSSAVVAGDSASGSLDVE